jgi:hypothetical protein
MVSPAVVWASSWLLAASTARRSHVSLVRDQRAMNTSLRMPSRHAGPATKHANASTNPHESRPRASAATSRPRSVERAAGDASRISHDHHSRSRRASSSAASAISRGAHA